MTSQSTNELKKFNTIDMKRTWHILNNITEKENCSSAYIDDGGNRAREHKNYAQKT